MAKRLTAQERRHGAAEVHLLIMPAGLTEAESIAWERDKTSPAALAATGISPDATIIVITWVGSNHGAFTA